jgi:hypothetical protein
MLWRAGRSAAVDRCEGDILLGHGRPDAESWVGILARIRLFAFRVMIP